jgi:tetratricopeptide (TPR) repeat protein
MSRNGAANLLKKLRTHPVGEIHEDFRRLQAQYPDSAHPYCYWGELLLWEGRFDDAFDAFNANKGAQTARWGFVGRAAVEVHRGNFDAAIDQFGIMGVMYEPVRGATTHVYLGELYRIQGQHERALRELEIAIRAKPARIGARINRALCWNATGEQEQARAELQELTSRWPNVFWHAAREIGCDWEDRSDALQEICLRALKLMRGNRSSHLHTFFDTEGQMRFTVDALAWSTHFEQCRSHLRLGALEQLLLGTR